MAIALDATQSGSGANTYLTEAEANEYFAAHFSQAKSSVWEGLESHQKVTLLRLHCPASAVKTRFVGQVITGF